MAAPTQDQDLLPEQTEGFKVGEKKTMAEIDKLGTSSFSSLDYVSTDLYFAHRVLLSFLPGLSTG